MLPVLDKATRPFPGLPRRSSLLALLTLSACTFHPGAADPGPDPGPGTDAAQPPDARTDASTPGPDAAPLPMPRDVVHVPENAWLGSDRVVMWTDDVTIDTTGLRISGPGAVDTQDLMFVPSPQQPSGPELALLYLADWTVGDGVTVRVVGNRPLVVISSGSIDLRGVIDASGQGQTPGPGGADSGEGQGAGQPGANAGQGNDSGGGGAGHVTTGARGGRGCPVTGSNCNLGGDVADGGPGGSLYGDPDVRVLEGGSGGGAGSAGGTNPCGLGSGGAGGGAVQLYALGMITMSGGINAGGGGGGGGANGASCNDTGGGGGGSGGAIYLQAERIVFSGTLAANGGGGGAGGSSDGTANGTDGALSDEPAPGGSLDADGSATDNGSSPGGAGAAGAVGPGQGGDEVGEPNGGGGGGAAGYVVLHCTELQDSGLTSPAAFRTAGCDPP